MNIVIPRVPMHHELAGGNVSWVDAEGRACSAQIEAVFDPDPKGAEIQLIVDAVFKEPPQGTDYRLERKKI